MKSILTSLLLALLSPLAQGQIFDKFIDTNAPPPPPIVNRTSQALARDANSTTWAVLDQTIYPSTGAVSNRTYQYVELGAGLNYLSDPSTGQWAPSEDLIELMPDGSAAALKGPTKLYLKPNLNSVGAVTIISAEGGVFKTQPTGLFWYDPGSGNASLIVRAQDCAGELEPPNQVVYRGAFGEVADLRLTYTKGAIESDLVLLQCPQLPPGFDPATARLELWHACQPVPALKITTHQVGQQGATDDVLDFGGLWFPTGAAYWADGSEGRAADIPAAVRVPTLTEDRTLAPVCKTWLLGPDQDVLVEAVAWKEVAARLASLPPTPPAYLPAPAMDRSSWLAELEATRRPSSSSPTGIGHGGGYHPVGLVWDYITLTGSYGSYTFTTGQTYYLSSNLSFSGNVTFNPCVIKFNSGSYILAYGSITCNGSSSSPTIFTSFQDDLFGLQVPQSSPCPSQAAAEALWVYCINANVSVSGLRFRWADTALRFDPGTCCNTYEQVSDCSFEFCGVGICVSCCSVTISGSTMCSVATPTQALYECASFTGSLTDICSGDSDANLVSDLIEYKYFGRLGTLPAHLISQTTNKVAGLSPGDAHQLIWSTMDHGNNNYQYNTNCWLWSAGGIPSLSHGISALSPYNNYGGTMGAGTLITPRHAITISHMWCPTGTVYRFIGKNNVSHSATLLQYQSPPDVDYLVLLFDQDLPTDTVAYVKVLTDDVRHKLTPIMEAYPNQDQHCAWSQRVPAVACGFNYKDAYITDLWTLYSPSDCFIAFGVSWPLACLRSTQWFAGWGSLSWQHYECDCGDNCDVKHGDSGHPTLFLINGELVLIGPMKMCCGASWLYGTYIDELNTVIANLDNWAWTNRNIPPSGYRATPYDLSGFPDLW
jgi:hypothetical protein